MEVFLSEGDFVLKSISTQQKGVGSVAVPAARCAVQHEGEKHQEGANTHPQNQPEPRSSGEKSKQLPLSSSALVNKLLTHAHMRTNTLSLRFLMQYPKIATLPSSTFAKVLTLVNLRPFVEPDLAC